MTKFGATIAQQNDMTPFDTSRRAATFHAGFYLKGAMKSASYQNADDCLAANSAK